MHAGPLGSTIHVMRADAGTIAELAAIDWTRSFRRVCLDPVGGLIVLMTPSRLHEELATMLDHIVDIAASTLGRAVKGLLASRLREPGAPPGTGLEPDCAFYVGERARAYQAALAEGRDAADAFFAQTPPDPGRRSPRSQTPPEARSRGTPISACGSCGSSAPATARTTLRWTSSPCAPAPPPGPSRPRASSAASRPPTCAKPCTACGAA